MARSAHLLGLQFGKTVDHNCVFIVRGNKGLEQVHAISRELAKAVVKATSQLTVSLNFALYDIIDVAFTLSEVFNDFLKVLAHEFLVRNELLSLFHPWDIVFFHISHHDCHSVTVVLAIEDHI